VEHRHEPLEGPIGIVGHVHQQDAITEPSGSLEREPGRRPWSRGRKRRGQHLGGHLGPLLVEVAEEGQRHVPASRLVGAEVRAVGAQVGGRPCELVADLDGDPDGEEPLDGGTSKSRIAAAGLPPV
jgi:hypothetical protein